jgi:hypothetical protein
VDIWLKTAKKKSHSIDAINAEEGNININNFLKKEGILLNNAVKCLRIS